MVLFRWTDDAFVLTGYGVWFLLVAWVCLLAIAAVVHGTDD